MHEYRIPATVLLPFLASVADLITTLHDFSDLPKSLIAPLDALDNSSRLLTPYLTIKPETPHDPSPQSR